MRNPLDKKQEVDILQNKSDLVILSSIEKKEKSKLACYLNFLLYHKTHKLND